MQCEPGAVVMSYMHGQSCFLTHVGMYGMYVLGVCNATGESGCDVVHVWTMLLSESCMYVCHICVLCTCACMCVCMYICMYACIYVCMHACMHA